MSALGHKQTYAVQKAVSASPLIATAKADLSNGHVCFTLKSGRHALCSSTSSAQVTTWLFSMSHEGYMARQQMELDQRCMTDHPHSPLRWFFFLIPPSSGSCTARPAK